MIVRKDEARKEERCIRGGKGEVKLTHLLEKEDLLGKSRMVAVMTLEPGVSVGEHDHTKDSEIYIVLKGNVKANDNGIETRMSVGDSMFTCNGETHWIENDTNEVAHVLGIVLL